MRSVAGLGTTTAWSIRDANQARSPSQIGTVSIQIGVPGTKASGKTTRSAPLRRGLLGQALDAIQSRLAVHQDVRGLTAATVVVVTVGLPRRCGKCRGTRRRGPRGYRARAGRLPSAALSFFARVADLAAQVGGLEHLGVAAVREDLADEPVRCRRRRAPRARSRARAEARRARCATAPPRGRRAPGRCGRPGACRLEAGRGSKRSSRSVALCIRSRRKLRSPSRVRSQVCTYQFGSSRRNSYGSTLRTLFSSPTATYSISTSRCSRIACESVRMSCSSRVPTVGLRRLRQRRTRRTSPRACARTRSSGVCASAAIIGPTNSSASRIARASSGVSRGGRRNVSPKSSLSHGTVVAVERRRRRRSSRRRS